MPAGFGCRAAIGNDAEVLVVGFHEDVAGAEVDFVGAEGALDAEKLVGERALLGDFERAGSGALRAPREVAALCFTSPIAQPKRIATQY